MPPSLLRETPWYERAFDWNYLRVYAHRNEEEAERCADQLVRWLQIGAGDRLLDVACGEGRYARAFSRRGLRVTGMDLSPDLITEARERARLLPGAPLYVRGDVRRLPYFRQFDAAVSMFTSFGYFDSREDDLRIFRGVARALVPGGRFVVDFMNASAVRAGLVPDEELVVDTVRLVVKRWIDEDADFGPRVCKSVIGYDHATGVREIEFDESVRLYTGNEIDALLTESGFELVDEPKGDLEGAPAGADAPRYVRIAELPRS